KQTVLALKVGNGMEEHVDLGPLIDQAAIDKVQEHVEDAISGGASALIGGRAHASGGLFYEPSILVNVSRQAKLMQEETFGPVAPLIRFSTEQEVIDLANDT